MLFEMFIIKYEIYIIYVLFNILPENFILNINKYKIYK